MSKKKNTLKDLDEFLKQQAATLVSPPSLREKIEETAPPAPAIKEQPKAEAPPPAPQASTTPGEVSSASILEDLKTLSEKEGVFFRQKLYDLIIQTLETQKKSLPEDKMLINTALYLKSGNLWKEAIREYWKKQ
ncbi:hypothetical protein SAMN04488109_4033 [Chryseolinea serpens]|uniref:Uncharacterized protein n=1 Tax=Chryseolinea serpens TaxID=947013 RepID=A0A1M5TEV6_9BACT|nr:hypothetical protein [Chryseolinea serpens]SHH49218.1 hypothetical protein SAMN04488109_4033 [Chryseolinea serpens]